MVRCWHYVRAWPTRFKHRTSKQRMTLAYRCKWRCFSKVGMLFKQVFVCWHIKVHLLWNSYLCMILSARVVFPIIWFVLFCRQTRAYELNLYNRFLGAPWNYRADFWKLSNWIQTENGRLLWASPLLAYVILSKDQCWIEQELVGSQLLHLYNQAIWSHLSFLLAFSLSSFVGAMYSRPWPFLNVI